MHLLRLVTLSATSLFAVPALAEVTVTHSIDGRFGVSYVSFGDGSGRAQPLYEGRYTTTFAHQADNGLRFRFDLGVVVGNMDSDRRDRGAVSTVQIGTGGD